MYMTRQNKLTSHGIALLLMLLLSTSCSPPADEEDTPLNVLFIAVDDLRTELNCYGASHIVSPNIDRLAAEGIRFDNAHVQQAICMASRASMLSGIRPEKFGIYTGEPVEKVLPDVMTLNKFFKNNGYTVSSVGKIYHYQEDTKAQFGGDWIEPGTTWNGEKYANQNSIEQGKKNTKGTNGPAFESADVPDEGYLDGINTSNALTQLSELKEAGKPFFMAVGLLKPHLPFAAPQKYWDMYPEGSVELPEIRQHPLNSGKNTLRTRGELTNYSDMPDTFAEVPDSTTINLRRAYYACVSYADAQVGKLLDRLEELGLRENTIVVLWGDHGYKLGDYGDWCKWSNMNLDTQIPLIFSVPGHEGGEVVNRAVESLDIYPTLAGLCGLDPPKHLEGENLTHLLENPSMKEDIEQYAYTIWPQNRWDYDRTVMGYSVKNHRFNYVEWVQLNTGEVLDRELYDHQSDPMETENVIQEVQYAEIVAQLAELTQSRINSTDHDHAFKQLR